MKGGARLAVRPVMREIDRWADASLAEVIDHIIETFHRPLPDTLDRVSTLAHAAIEAADPGAERDQLAHAATLLDELREVQLDHIRQEEELVFPWLLSPSRASAGVLVNLLGRDHADIVRLLREIHELVAPIAVARDLAAAVADLAARFRDHLAIENGVLFPRALTFVPGR